MKEHDLLAYQDLMAAATRDIHRACGDTEVSVLWDDGKLAMVGGLHKVKVWNALGAEEFHITHDELTEHGNAYKGLLAMVAAAAKKKMKL